MQRWSILVATWVLVVGALVLVVFSSAWWWFAAGPLVALAGVALYDVTQRGHAVLRNYPIIGHARYLAEQIRPELLQYFVERDHDGRPFNRHVRSIVYQRAKGTQDNATFGTDLDVYAAGYESFAHSMTPTKAPETPPRIRIGGPRCTQPYEMSLFNVSAMSYGSLSANAIRALNSGAAAGGFAHDTGEGGISNHHLHDGDLIWEIGTGYFGCRTPDGAFDPDAFARKAAMESVRAVLVKLSQGAKPGLGGVLPGSKVDSEIAEVRGVPVGETVASPPYHQEFSTPRELVRFLGRLRELADGKPVGFKLCVGTREQVLAVCQAMIEEGDGPDFIVVDGSEGGTGSAPLEFINHIGTPLTEGLHIVHNALVGSGLRDRIAVGASGKVATGSDIVKRMIQGADFTNSARGMMFALGCIQAQRCHTNECPVGVATQDPKRSQALVVHDKTTRVQRYHESTVDSAMQIIASMGLTHPEQLRPAMLRKRIDDFTVRSYAELYDYLEPRVLVDGEAPEEWARGWKNASPDRFSA